MGAALPEPRMNANLLGRCTATKGTVMAMLMTFVQATAFFVASWIAFHFTACGSSAWKGMVGFFLAIPAGFLAASVIGMAIGEVLAIEATSVGASRLFASAFWFSIFGSIGGVLYGRLRARKMRG